MARWGRRLAWTCAAVVMVAGTVWAAQEVLKYFIVAREVEEVSSETVDTPDGPIGVSVSVGRAFGVVTDDPDFTEADAKQRVASLQEQLAKGEYELVDIDVDERGLRLYRYKVLMPDGTERRFGGGSPPDRDRVADAKEATALRKAGEGELIGYGERQDPMPFVIYEYRYDLPDGHTVSVGGNQPYLGSEDEDVREIKELVEGGQGELLPGPSTGRQVARYKVTLSDGRVMHYSTDSER